MADLTDAGIRNDQPDVSSTTSSTATPGLINSTAPGVVHVTPEGGGQPTVGYNPANAAAAAAKTTGYSPESYTVAPNQTVAGQLKDIIASGSPLMQQAEAGARDQMNQRGLINSSMGITAGQSAVIGAALPIANADAQTYDRASANTTTAVNTAKGFEAGAKNNAGLQDAAAETQTSQFNAGQKNASLSQTATASNTTTLAKLQADSQRSLQELVGSQQLRAIDAQGQIQTTLTKMTDDNKLLLQSSQGASSLYNTQLQYMNAIMSSPTLDAGQKRQALQNSVTTLNDALDTMTSIANIPGVQSTLDFGELRVPDAVPYVAPPAAPGGLFG